MVWVAVMASPEPMLVAVSPASTEPTIIVRAVIASLEQLFEAVMASPEPYRSGGTISVVPPIWKGF